MRKSSLCLLLILVGVVGIPRVGSAQSQVIQTQVTLEQSNGQFRLLRNGEPYAIKGAGGESYFAELAAAGGNSVRTWGADNLGDILEQAHQHGLTVCAGLWLGHQRHGFNYQDQGEVLRQLDESLAVVRQYKDHPALLMWGVGNEAEGDGKDPSVWYAINHIAREIKRIDPHHPTMTVIAELGEEASKVRSIERFCPDIDIIGVNSYGGIESIGDRYRSANGTKPYIITEHGTLGPWEVEKTSWGSSIEQTSTEKGKLYSVGYRANVVQQAELCLGTYAFLWGHKQETTATWFGMLLPNGDRLAAVDVMTQWWTGKPPSNQCPEIASLAILSLAIQGSSQMKPGAKLNATVTATDPDGDTVTIQWVLRSDSGTIGVGGDREEDETTYPDAVESAGPRATVTLPKQGGGYRLFAYVYDGNGGAAVANVPLYAETRKPLTTTMPVAKLPYAVYADNAKTSVYVPSGYMGNVASIAMQLDSTDQPHRGETCLKAEYKSGDSWGGVLWQSPAEDWDGKQPGGANLSGATHLEFWARGANGGEQVNFVFGVLDADQPYRDSAKGELKDVKLTKEWNKYTIALRGLDLRQIKTGFGWSLAGQGKPVTFYLDDIRYVKE